MAKRERGPRRNNDPPSYCSFKPPALKIENNVGTESGTSREEERHITAGNDARNVN
jgi:hypothetical protein